MFDEAKRIAVAAGLDPDASDNECLTWLAAMLPQPATARGDDDDEDETPRRRSPTGELITRPAAWSPFHI